ncbi:Transcription initiation factor TFIIH subunit 1 [Paragonimus heterotremus]|uniref:Transcription initiation factor TFIIH subunit 1 n=1 Tax=Paragonimus heterotremus TaxID=100268 RepID=A0A8J4T686_9TREM|nr:Transcription initiation factor TFIIH subunit 1 [Paragonimus heterotremus]
MTKMSTQKEDVLFMVKHVRYKKVDGTLYVNSGRVAWRNQTSDTFRISAAFEDIRVQRISPDQKEKVQLQLLMHNGESFTFQFSDPAGREKQLEMRNNVKEMLQSLLPKFKDKAHSELQEKFRLLGSNPEILALYKELVVTGILSSDEFWARPEFSNSTIAAAANEASVKSNQRKSDSRAPSTMANATATAVQSHSNSSTPTGQISRSFQLADKPQLVGVPSYLLSDIKPEADGANGIKYNLTHETIDAIFRAYPTVRQRHRELVPDKLSEADFWIKFFQSHYFHRDRVQLPKEDIFAECAVSDERLLQNEMRRSRRSRITAHLDLDCLSDHDLGTGYGCELGPSASETQSKPAAGESGNQPSHLSANQLLLRRFNSHSILVLKSLGTNDIASGLASVTQTIEPTTQPHSGALEHNAHGSLTIKERVYGPELVSDPEPPQMRLDLTSVNDYLEGPTSKDSAISNGTNRSNQPTRQASSSYSASQLEDALRNCKASMSTAYQTKRKPHAPVLASVDAQMALADVSPGGCLVGGQSVDEFKSVRSNRSEAGEVLSSSCRPPIDTSRSLRGSQTEAQLSGRQSASANGDVDRGPAILSPEQVRELSLLYASAAELLRHFWACFPVTNPQLIEKLERIANSLNRFRTTKVAQFAASFDSCLGGKQDSSLSALNSSNSCVSGERSSLGSLPCRSRVTGHLECMLDAAQQKYSEWKARRRR